MCLDTIIRTKPKPTGMGYKVFKRRRNGVLYGEYSKGTRPKGRWLKAKDYRAKNTASMTRRYPPAFHVFKTRKGAERWVRSCQVIFSVQYRGAYIQGYQAWEAARSMVVVAKEIFILNEV
jgi:hypothetical protein